MSSPEIKESLKNILQAPKVQKIEKPKQSFLTGMTNIAKDLVTNVFKAVAEDKDFIQISIDKFKPKPDRKDVKLNIFNLL